MKLTLKKIKKYLKLALIAFGAIASAILINKGRKAIVAKVQKPSNFWTIDGDDKHLKVVNKLTGKVETVKLPSAVSAKKVKAIELDKTNVKVEVLHEKVDRRNVSPIDNSALDRLNSDS